MCKMSTLSVQVRRPWILPMASTIHSWMFQSIGRREHFPDTLFLFGHVSPANIDLQSIDFHQISPKFKPSSKQLGLVQEQQVGQVLRLLEILIWKDSELQDLLQREGSGWLGIWGNCNGLTRKICVSMIHD